MKVRVRGPVVLFVTGSEFPVTPKVDEYFDENDPVVRQHRWAFASDDELAGAVDVPQVESVRVEQATAGPGERRNARRQ